MNIARRDSRFTRYSFLVAIFFLAGIINITFVDPAIAQKTNSQSSQTYNSRDRQTDLLLTGKQLYDRGQLMAATQLWLQARQESRDSGHIDRLIHSNNYLAIVYQDLGNWDKAAKAIADNLELIVPSDRTIARRNVEVDSPLLYAQTLVTKGSWQLKQGQADAAIATWQQAESIYHRLNDTQGIILTQIDLAQALQTLGYFRRSQKQLERVRQQLDSIANPSLKIATLQTLGTALEVSGDLLKSQTVLQQSLELAKQTNSASDVGETLFRLGNVARSSNNTAAALDYYQQAIAISPNLQTILNAELNQLSLLIEREEIVKAERAIATIEPKLLSLPASRTTIYALLNYAQSAIALNRPSVESILQQAVRQAQKIEDNIALAYSLEKLGFWHELQHDYETALNLSDRALTLAEAGNTAQITATLHWQRGRILKARGSHRQAIAAYQSAVDDLDSLHRDLVAVNPTLQFSFRQQVEPMYRQLVELLLEDVNRLSPAAKQQNLERSRVAIEALQQKELENFFRIACLDVNQQNIEQIDERAAVIYPILLDKSIEVIVSLPNLPLQHYRTKIDRQQQNQTFNELLQYLNPVFSSQDIHPTAQKLYDWSIRPVESMLAAQKIDTLVFVLDGKLRNLPMSVLHDGEKYLIEKYNLALTPGLELLASKTKDKQKLNVLTGGLTKSRQGFSALPGVAAEISEIEQIMPSQTLLDRDFTNQNIQQKVALESSEIVHLATHGQFSSSAENTYILTWDKRINVARFDRLLRDRQNDRPIELLVLSACKTAAGDEQAILGLAGMAIRSGARSTVATLWSVSDRSTAKLIPEFYSHLSQPNITKAQAMRQAQLSLLQDREYEHPYYWSPFVLLGNWL